METQAGGLLQVNIQDRETLQSSYMPFVEGGGLFIPTKQIVSMGDEIFIVATLPNMIEKFPIKGKVIWISYKQSGIKPQGFGIQLLGEKGLEYKSHVEKILAGSMTTARSSFTM